MRYGVFSDIHGNLEAFLAVLVFFEQEKVSSFICCGDIVGYGPNPNECIEELLALKHCIIVGGNHDKAVVGMKDTRWFNDFASRAITWTRRQLTSSYHGFLTRMPNTADHSKFFVAHGSPRDPLDEYLLSPTQFQDSLEYFQSPICFVGHTHVPSCFLCDRLSRIKIKSPIAQEEIKIEPDSQMLYNPGAVGQPRDGDPRAACAIYDTDRKTVRLHHIEYDIAKTQGKMRRAQLPLYLIDRLAEGR